MDTLRTRLMELAIENLPFAHSAQLKVLDWGCETGATTWMLQNRLPFCTVHGCDNPIHIANARKQFPKLQNQFMEYRQVPREGGYDLVILVSNGTNLCAQIEFVKNLTRRWVMIFAPYVTYSENDWKQLGFQAHLEITTEPDDGVYWCALYDREYQEQAVERILIASPVRQSPEILRAFLTSLSEQDTQGYDVDYLFVDNNDEAESSCLLREFAETYSGRVHLWTVPVFTPYQRQGVTHVWTEQLVWRLASIKDAILEFMLEHDYDAIWFIDSDLIVPPNLLRRLCECNRAIVSEVFWTKWRPEVFPLPNVWYRDFYTMHRTNRGENQPAKENERRMTHFLNTLALAPGLHRVHGLGACTLIRREPIEARARFSEIGGLSFWGEDRHFCVRAEALGFTLYADTTLPPFHLYRLDLMDRLGAYRQALQANMEPTRFVAKVIELSGGSRGF